MQIMPTLRTLALVAADVLEHQPISLGRSAAADLYYFGVNGRSRYSSVDPQLVMIGPVALTRPLRRQALWVLRDLRDAWVSARSEVDIQDASARAWRKEMAPAK